MELRLKDHLHGTHEATRTAGLLQQMPDAGYRGEVGRDNKAPADWEGQVEATWLNYERNPFTGKPFFNEVCMHRASYNISEYAVH